VDTAGRNPGSRVADGAADNTGLSCATAVHEAVRRPGKLAGSNGTTGCPNANMSTVAGKKNTTVLEQ
jgi:hypothetical protein